MSQTGPVKIDLLKFVQEEYLHFLEHVSRLHEQLLPSFDTQQEDLGDCQDAVAEFLEIHEKNRVAINKYWEAIEQYRATQ